MKQKKKQYCWYPGRKIDDVWILIRLCYFSELSFRSLMSHFSICWKKNACTEPTGLSQHEPTVLSRHRTYGSVSAQVFNKCTVVIIVFSLTWISETVSLSLKIVRTGRDDIRDFCWGTLKIPWWPLNSSIIQIPSVCLSWIALLSTMGTQAGWPFSKEWGVGGCCV